MEQQQQDRYYDKISGLSVPESSCFNQIDSEINRFIDTVPNLMGKLEESFSGLDRNLDSFLSDMELLVLLMRNVHAQYLEIEAESILNSVKNDPEYTLARKLMKQFVSDILSLSIAMQKAQNSIKKDENEEVINEIIESHADIAKNASMVGSLINSGEYEKAQKMITGMTEDKTEVMMFRLLDLITSGKYGEAESVANVLKEKHVEAINQFVGVDLSKKILAVDDMPEMLSFINNALKKHYKVFAVPSAKTAVKVMDVQKPDLFILDIDMPEMNGFQLAEIIRGKPEFANAPIIFLTGNSSRDCVVKAMAAGGNEFIVKPTTHENLLTKTGKFINKTGLVDHYHRMLEKYERDELTGLYGNNKFRDFIKDIESRASSVGVIFLDVNDLKKYNDTAGHHAGDLLIQKAADSIMAASNENIHAFRNGGDEFVVVMPNCAESDISNFMDDWRKKLAELNTKDDGIHCSVSAGSAFGAGKYSMSDLLKLADERMYEDKRSTKGAV
ncbi:MAG: diguanylate cyclase [Chitinispirillia bacterium]|nr:diguanylate cyclase [Chitinispirillia bacterium]